MYDSFFLHTSIFCDMNSAFASALCNDHGCGWYSVSPESNRNRSRREILKLPPEQEESAAFARSKRSAKRKPGVKTTKHPTGFETQKAHETSIHTASNRMSSANGILQSCEGLQNFAVFRAELRVLHFSASLGGLGLGTRSVASSLRYSSLSGSCRVDFPQVSCVHKQACVGWLPSNTSADVRRYGLC